MVPGSESISDIEFGLLAAWASDLTRMAKEQKVKPKNNKARVHPDVNDLDSLEQEKKLKNNEKEK